MQKSTERASRAKSASSSRIRWLEERIVFLVSASSLRAVSAVVLLAGLAAVAVFLWSAVPTATPEAPPEPAPVVFAGKTSVNAAEVLAPLAPAPSIKVVPPSAGAPPVPAATQQQRQEATQAAPAVVTPPVESPLDVAFRPYKALADKISMRFDSAYETYCAESDWAGRCARMGQRITVMGLRDLILRDVFLSGADTVTNLAILARAEKLFAAIGSTAQPPYSLSALETKDGQRIFRENFLAPARDLIRSFRVSERALPREVPAGQRLALVADIYPMAEQALGTGGTPDERRVRVGNFAKLLAEREEARGAQVRAAIEAHGAAVRKREGQVVADRLAYEAKVAAKAELRWKAAQGFGGVIAALTLVGLLLALLAVERHLRAIRESLPSLASVDPLRPLSGPALPEVSEAAPVAVAPVANA